ncbi:hypothetical protein OE88DRAFT_1738022 [Heliocybe sulcata]|uniref:Uncharacterized protein n=1 Tax=Heliocybe sulcata TaxID=5364 RepID=A0A5C3MU42_9AGAM|nr:hypothetical protein OE88DRAFT_1738022 [Heliocybe sulcata]
MITISARKYRLGSTVFKCSYLAGLGRILSAFLGLLPPPDVGHQSVEENSPSVPSLVLRPRFLMSEVRPVVPFPFPLASTAAFLFALLFACVHPHVFTLTLLFTLSFPPLLFPFPLPLLFMLSFPSLLFPFTLPLLFTLSFPLPLLFTLSFPLLLLLSFPLPPLFPFPLPLLFPFPLPLLLPCPLPLLFPLSFPLLLLLPFLLPLLFTLSFTLLFMLSFPLLFMLSFQLSFTLSFRLLLLFPLALLLFRLLLALSSTSFCSISDDDLLYWASKGEEVLNMSLHAAIGLLEKIEEGMLKVLEIEHAGAYMVEAVLLTVSISTL